MHNHNWSKTGIWETETQGIYPCLIPDCPAALLKVPGQDIETGELLPERLSGVIQAFDGLTFEDDPVGSVVKVLAVEVIESYGFDKLRFKPGDAVLDIGAHVGVVSIWLAKQYPNITVYAFEPVPQNFIRLIANIIAAGVENVKAYNQAVTGDGRRVSLRVNLSANSAGSSAYTSEGEATTIEVESITLADIFERFNLNRVRLLKIDSEGAEYDTLMNTPADVLSRIDFIRGEFHTNKRLRKAGHKPPALRKWLRDFGIKVKTDTCKMAE